MWVGLVRTEPREFGLSVLPDDRFAAAALPLFESGIVDVVEWGPDLGWRRESLPSWLDPLLDDFAEAGALLGHGVSFSVLSAVFTPRHQAWLDNLSGETANRPYRQFSEHVGFMGAGRFSFAAPLPCPVDDELIRVGQDRVARLSHAAGMPIGLENLATSLGVGDGIDQPELIEALLAPTDGFMVLDLHNLWTQATNLLLDPVEQLHRYPLHRVREIHVSGGSWSTTANSSRSLRRDTHDDVVPEAVASLLPLALAACPSAAVIYERLPRGLERAEARMEYQADVQHIAAMVHSFPRAEDAPLASPVPQPPLDPVESPRLAAYQATLLDVLDQTNELADYARKAALWAAQSDAAHSEYVEALDPALLAVAAELVATWGTLG